MSILVVFTGGTIGSLNNDGVISPDSSSNYRLIEMYKSAGGNADFDTAAPYTLLSENLTGEYFSLLYNSILENINRDYDGIIVTHGTDTLQYTSAALSYFFGLCRTPIVLVSANYPLDNPNSNGLNNFKAAVDFISSGSHRGVFTAYKNDSDNPKIHRASRLQNHLAYDDKLYSIDDKYYGEFIGEEFRKNSDYSEKSDELRLDFIPKFSADSPILKITPYVGMRFPENLDNVKAILLESYHSGTINTSNQELKNFCQSAKALSIPVFLTGSKAGFFYESKKLYSELGINVLPPAAPTAAYIKLWLLSEYYNSSEDIFSAFSKSLGGDIL